MIKETNYGILKVNNTLFAKIIYESICKTNDEVYFSSFNPKVIATKNKKGSTNNLANNIIVNYNDNNIIVTFFVIMKFGTSIYNNQNIILDNALDALIPLFKDYNITLQMRVVGVKSKLIASRNLEFVKKYELE